MFKELIKSLGFMYTFISRGRGRLTKAELQDIAAAGGTFVNKSEILLDQGETMTEDQKIDLDQAVLMEQHVTEIVQFLLNQEII